MIKKLLFFVAVLSLAALSGAACAQPGTPQPPPDTANYTLTQLKYLLSDEFGEPFYVDADLYPIARPGVEEQHAAEQLPSISANTEEFPVLLQHIGLPKKPEYTPNETLAIYREHKKLIRGFQMTPFASGYSFSMRIKEGQGEQIEGTITNQGKITVTKREPSFNTYPICLAKGTLIDTPNGQVAVEKITIGMTVWTVDASGHRIAAGVTRTVSTPVPQDFQVMKVILSDGRMVTASPGHPTADSRAIGDYQVGDSLDGARVVSVERMKYLSGATYDILPAGASGKYWANGLLLMTTLLKN